MFALRLVIVAKSKYKIRYGRCPPHVLLSHPYTNSDLIFTYLEEENLIFFLVLRTQMFSMYVALYVCAVVDDERFQYDGFCRNLRTLCSVESDILVFATGRLYT